ncbi:thiamine pyrophosphate-binding protein [Kocuria sediminis]|uniref:Thiamine pyrophosphate-binding protein n=1 Tax=Kocuria sediminis TaxID=1038857 RepID=A0A6N8GMK1_9MICC|nr:thiamine pyrophosphate-binding protein [Kocuria sediminis]
MSGTVAQLVGRTLAELGAGHVFGVVGSGNFHLTNALIAAGVPFTAARHEGGAATMADAWARTSGRVAVLTTHQGCGLTNAVTGIGEAAKSRTPLVVLTADAQAAAVHSNFRVDQDGLARSVGAVAERVHSPASAVADVVRAFRRARNDRRTVVLSVPLDVQAAAAPETSGAAAVPPAPRVRPHGDDAGRLAALLATARRPVLVAGRGARGARAELAALAERTGALLATSAVAKGLFAGEEFDLGISGGFSTPLAAELIGAADLVVGWGCALNMWTTRHGRLIGPEAAVVQVDVEEAALGAHRPVDRPLELGVVGDCAQTARDVLAALEGAPEASSSWRSPELAARIAREGRWRDVPFEDLSTGERIDPRVLSRELDALLPAERVVAVDSGNFMGYPSQYLSVPDERGFCFTQAFQSVGLGLATAIGAALAQPHRLPVLGTGDGGFLMGVAELETAVRLGLPLVCVVYDDAAYGAEVHHFAGPGAGDVPLDTVVFPDVDIAAVGRGFGAEGVVVRRVEDLAAVRAWADGPRDRPLVVDAKIASDGGAWWLAEAFRGH